MMKFAEELKELCLKHGVSLEGQLLIHPEHYPQAVEYQETVHYGRIPVRDREGLLFFPVLPERAPVEIVPDRRIHVSSDYQGYTCPVTGNWIDGKRDHRENLKRHNCHVVENGEKEHSLRTREENTATHAEKSAQMLAEKVMARVSGY